MNLPRIILKKLREEHMGRDNAIKRPRLLSWLRDQGATINDREMRAIKKTMPIICSCENGYFIATSYSEVEYSLKYKHKKAMSLLKDIRNQRNAYPQFYEERQGYLFEEEA